MDSFIPPALRRQRNQRRQTLEAVSGASGMPQHLSEIESGKRDPRLSSIERIAEAMGLSVMLVPEHMAPEIRRYIATQGRVYTAHGLQRTSGPDMTPDYEPKMPKKPSPNSPKTKPLNNALTFQIRQELDPDTGEPIEFGWFSRNWDYEQELDELMDNLNAGRINDKQALLHAQKLLAKYPGNLEIQNYLANRLWALEMRDEATDIWAKAYSQACALIPKGYQGQIIWSEIDNRPFLRVAFGYLQGLIDRKDAKAAQALAKKMLAWCPSDNLGVRMRMGDMVIVP